MSTEAPNKREMLTFTLNPCAASSLSSCRRKLIHHRKETLARRSSSSSGSRQGLPSSNSEISLSHTPPPPPNGLNRDYGRQGSVPLSGSMDSMQAEQGFYQVTHDGFRSL